MNKTIGKDQPANVIPVFSSTDAPSFGIEAALQSLCNSGLPAPKKLRVAPALRSRPSRLASEDSDSHIAEVVP